jgi:hypothetical protein
VKRCAGALVVAVGSLLAGCGSPTPSDENLGRNETVLASTPLPDGTEEVVRTSDRRDVDERHCVDVTSVELRPPTGEDDDAIVEFFDQHFDAAGWTTHHGESAAGLVAIYEMGTASVTVSTERLRSDGTYELSATQPC